MLIHQIPPKPSYLRAKIWRRLLQIGAVAIKQSVYVTPQSEQCYEDLSWILKEIAEGGGEASLSVVRFMEGLTDEQIIALFQTARKSDYERIIQEANAYQEQPSDHETDPMETAKKLKLQLAKLQTRFDQVVGIDFFSAPERSATEITLADMEAQLYAHPLSRGVDHKAMDELKKKTWVTRENVYVDRMACGWLVRRFVDPEAKFKFIPSNQYTPGTEEVRFDLFEAEFTHVGDQCSFEVMIEHLGLADKALIPLAEIVHDLDLKDGKHGRPETAGLSAIVNGLVATHASDQDRLEHGVELFDQLFEFFRRQKER